MIRVYFGNRLEELELDPDVSKENGFLWLGPPEAQCAVWFPITKIATEIVARADQWRRQRRIPTKRWPARL